MNYHKLCYLFSITLMNLQNNVSQHACGRNQTKSSIYKNQNILKNFDGCFSVMFFKKNETCVIRNLYCKDKLKYGYHAVHINNTGCLLKSYNTGCL